MTKTILMGAGAAVALLWASPAHAVLVSQGLT